MKPKINVHVPEEKEDKTVGMKGEFYCAGLAAEEKA